MHCRNRNARNCNSVKSEVLETTVLSVYTTDLEKDNKNTASPVRKAVPVYRYLDPVGATHLFASPVEQARFEPASATGTGRCIPTYATTPTLMLLQKPHTGFPGRLTGLEPAYGGTTSRCIANSATATVSPARLERASDGS